jgi:hypothetical protein
MTRPTVICLTPVKNEAWILDRFLRCASLWADHIVIADQGSDDGSREIACSFPKVTLIDNPGKAVHEEKRQRLLIEAARQFPEPRLLIALDADEILTANVLCSPEWQTVLSAPPGTVIRFPWATILPGVRSYWLYPEPQRFGFMDDGSEHQGREIHSPRIPVRGRGPVLTLSRVAVMHYVGVDPQRWRSKLRWYQCWEQLNGTGRRPAELYRFYHKDLSIPEREIRRIPPSWLRGYQQRGIDMTTVAGARAYRWDREILRLFAEHGTRRFRKLAIWDESWTSKARALGVEVSGKEFRDPRSRIDRLVHGWLRRTQPYYSHYGPEPSFFRRVSLRAADALLRAMGW